MFSLKILIEPHLKAAAQHGRKNTIVSRSAACWEAENHSHICMKTFGKVCVQDLSAGGHFIASAVEPGRGQTPMRTHENGRWTLGYADYTAILISGKLLNMISELLQGALGMLQQSCDWTQLSVNPQKMVIMPFTRRRGLRGVKELQPSLDTHWHWLLMSYTLHLLWTKYW